MSNDEEKTQQPQKPDGLYAFGMLGLLCSTVCIIVYFIAEAATKC